jgi:hypothetical protein
VFSAFFQLLLLQSVPHVTAWLLLLLPPHHARQQQTPFGKNQQAKVEWLTCSSSVLSAALPPPAAFSAGLAGAPAPAAAACT